MLGHSLVILSDAHIGAAPDATEDALLAFLDDVPALGDCLLVNGDLFQFWFTYRRVIPRRGFAVAARIAALARTIPIAMVGGNHDRWGDSFWAEQRGVRYGPHELRFEIGARRVRAVHGDGLGTDAGLRALLHRAVGLRATSALYRLIHPDLGMPLAAAAGPLLGGTPADPARRSLKADRQRSYAEAALRNDPGVDLLVMGHTHMPALVSGEGGRQYVNPGAWVDGLRYAVAGEGGAVLRQFAPD